MSKFEEIKSVEIIGGGNVAWHLSRWLHCNPVSSRTLEGLRKDADIYIISVSDDAIATVAENMIQKIGIDVLRDRLVVHTSGTSATDVLPSSLGKRGVLYPMQTFSAGKELDYSQIPLFVEAQDKNLLTILHSFARKMSPLVFDLDSAGRKHLHLAAVFACNYVTLLFSLASRQMQTIGLDFKLLEPLVRETVEKSFRIPPEEAQTGPARRHDISTISAHLNLLDGQEKEKQLYSTIAQMIMGKYDDKGHLK